MDTPRPERVTLTDEERAALVDLAMQHPQSFDEIIGTYGRLLAAREQALREEIAQQVEALAVLTGDEESRLYDAYRFGDDGVAHRDAAEQTAARLRDDAARIARGETR